jgi:hypothetical protein
MLFSVDVQGVGLAGASSADIVAPDASWRIPLDITASTDSTLSAQAEVPTPVPNAVLQIQLTSGSGSASSFTAASCDAVAYDRASTYYNALLYADPRPNASTKDFAFFYNTSLTGGGSRDLFHLMYIRHIDSTGAEPALAHAWSTDLLEWRVDTLAFEPIPNSGTRWDRLHVWAPSIVARGDTTYMFYRASTITAIRAGYTPRLSLTPAIPNGTATIIPRSVARWWHDPQPRTALFCRDLSFEHPDSSGVLLSTCRWMSPINQPATAVGPLKPCPRLTQSMV